MSTAGGFRAVYRHAATYEHLLLPHYFEGQTDEQLVTRTIEGHYGPAVTRSLRIVEFGCGTGRLTRHLEPYANELVCVDSSPSMIEALQGRLQAAFTLCRDTREAVTLLHDGGLTGSFDLVTSFWSLNYPLGEYFEQLDANGIQPTENMTVARRLAAGLIAGLLGLLKTGGHLLVLMFDPDTAEQRLVTAIWERVAPFPPGGRGYTRELLLDQLRDAEIRGEGLLTHFRCSGTAAAADRQAAMNWFTVVHLKGLPRLVNDPAVISQIERFVDQHTAPSGQVLIPTGAHVIDFHATHEPDHHLPDGWPQ